MNTFFFPTSVMVIGVSTRPTNLGKEIARNLLEFGFTGEIHLVGTKGGVIFGRRIHSSVTEVTAPVDLALILTPARTVPGFLEECGKLGIKRVIIESGGFGELDESGRELGRTLIKIATEYNMRFMGPNCIGLMNSDNGLATPFITLRNVFRTGRVGTVAQSGGVALSFLNMFDGERIGYGKFAAIGNKLNVNENDFLEYYLNDPKLDAVCMYLESIQDGAKLMRLALSSDKPVIIFKANTVESGSAIARSHTEALANDDKIVDAAFKQAGIVRFNDMLRLMDFLKALQLPPMLGRRLAIVSRSGGHAVIAVDAASQAGFQLPPFGADFLSEVRGHLRGDVIRLGNPLDLGDLFDFEIYKQIVEHTLQEPDIDGILFLHIYFAAIESEASRALLAHIAALSRKYDKPVAMCVLTETQEMTELHKSLNFPIYVSPERAVFALAATVNQRETRSRLSEDPGPTPPTPEPQWDAVDAILERSLAEGRSPLLHEGLAMLESLGFQTPPSVFVQKGTATDVQPSFPGPYAVKVSAAALSHKSDAGGVILGVQEGSALTETIHALFAKFAASEIGLQGVLIQQMAIRSKGDFEFIVGAKHDPSFGPVIMLGHGGIFVESLGVTSLRVAPVSLDEIDRMIDDLQGSEMFKGVRGLPPIDREALKDAMNRIAWLMQRRPGVTSIEVNPLMVGEHGAVALDARVHVDCSAPPSRD